MNLDKLTSFAISAVLAAALMGNLDRLQLWILKSQAKLLYESRASAWGNPSVFKGK
ncbi:MAG: hypothetical protein NDI63_12065 [Pseudobdellovibrio sp.]|nr:hypothetical protein [Pseudobdellovibrio sp.]